MVEQRTLGRTGLQVSVLGFGGSEIGHAPIAREALERLLDIALESGITVIDTAECYADSEEAIGQAVQYWPAGYTAAYQERLRRLDYHFLKQGEPQRAVETALRFTLSTAGVTTAIVGTTNPERLRQNARLAEAGPLDAVQIQAIRDRWQAVADPSWVGQG